MAKQLPKNRTTQSVATPVKKSKRQVWYLIIGVILGIILTSVFFLYAGDKDRVRNAGGIGLSSDNTPTFSNLQPPALVELSSSNLNSIKIDIEKHLRQHKVLNRISDASVVFQDLNTGKEFIVNQPFVFSPSSLMKVPVMMTVLKKAQENPVFLETKILYERSMELTIKGPEAVLRVETPMVEGIEYTIEELLELMICKSDNEATFLLLNAVGIERVHEVEKKVGFVFPAHVKKYYESYITADKYALFFKSLYAKEILNEEMTNYAFNLMARAEWYHGIRRAIPENLTVFHKYGLNSVPYSATEERVNQVHHFAIVDLPGNPFLIGVATAGDDELSMAIFIESTTVLIFNKLLEYINYMQNLPV